MVKNNAGIRDDDKEGACHDSRFIARENAPRSLDELTVHVYIPFLDFVLEVLTL